MPEFEENKGFKMKGNPMQRNFGVGVPVDDGTKESNVSAYLRKNKQYVDKDKTTPLDPGYEDTEKIQKIQKEGLTPYSQNFGKKKNL